MISIICTVYFIDAFNSYCCALKDQLSFASLLYYRKTLMPYQHPPVLGKIKRQEEALSFKDRVSAIHIHIFSKRYKVPA